MGAIAGIQYLNDFSKTDVKESMQNMLEAMMHRAPEYKTGNINPQGSYGVRYHPFAASSNSIAFDNAKNLLVIMDGEIFNVIEGATYDGKAGNDAEIVLDLYRKEGDLFAEKIDGSYAIAIWDEFRQKLILTRDRVGFKPLFYLKQDHLFIFASEIKAILASGLYHKSVDLVALNNFLSYWYVPNPDTLLESIKQVRPGHQLILENGNLSEKAYWKFTYRQDVKDQGKQYYKARFLEVFRNAVSRRLQRHPNCGAFLSGGLDTSGVVAVMRELTKEPFKVFTGGFEDKQYNEVGDAKIVADHLNLDHLSILIELTKDLPQILEKIVWYHDSPFVDTSAIPSYFAAKLAKEHVNVVLTGDLPDQLIGGSGHHVKSLSKQQSGPFVYRLLRNRGFNYIATHLPWSSGGTSLIDKIIRVLYRETFPLEEQRIMLNMPAPELFKRRLYSPDMLRVNRKNNPLDYARSLYKEVEEYELLDKLLYFDTLSYATDDLMIKVERMTMAHGLVAISPFHDKEFVEFVATLPTHYKIRDMVRKYIMKEALRPLLPEHTLNKKKKGFDMPIEDWLIKIFPDYVRDILLDSKTLNRGYFDKAFMRKMVLDYLRGKTDYASGSTATIISLITLELWHRSFVDT